MKKFLILLLPVFLVIVSGCSKVSESSNKAPGISSVSQPATSISDNAVVVLSAVASDPDGDPVTYKWTATAGVIPTDNIATITWLAPDYSGVAHTAYISLSVSDGKSSTSYVWTFSINPTATTPGGTQQVTSNQQYSQPVTVDPKITPSTPTGFYANTQISEICMQWNPVTTFRDGSSIAGKLSKYRIYRAVREAGPFDTDSTPFYLHAEVSSNITSFSEVATGVQFWYKITAVSTSGNESLQSGTITSLDNIAPAIPGIKYFNAYNPYSNDITLYWDRLALADLAGYRIYRADASKLNALPNDYDNHDGTYKLVGETGYEYFTDHSLVGTGNYFYRISAYDFSGNESAMSQYGWVNNVVPPPPASISAVAVTQSVTVYWTDNWSDNDVIDKAGYRLYYNFSPLPAGTFGGVEQAREDELTYTRHKYVMSAESGRTYYFFVIQVDIFGNISTAKSCSVTVP